MRKLILFGSLAALLAIYPPLYSAEPPSSQAPFPEDLSDAWERLQGAIRDWSGRLRDSFGAHTSREDRPVITQILNNKGVLGLSADQERKLEQLRDNFQRQSIRTDADSRIIELDIAALLDNEPVDLAKVDQKIRESEKLRADLRIARIRIVEQARAVLNPEQKKKFQEIEPPRLPRLSRSGQNPPARERE